MNEKDFINQMESAFRSLGFDVDINQLSDEVKKQVKGVADKLNPTIEKCLDTVVNKCGGHCDANNNVGCKCDYESDRCCDANNNVGCPCDCGSDGCIARSMYIEDVKDGDYTVIVLAYGHDENDITVNINPTENRIEISSSLDSKMKDSWFIADVDGFINMPSNVDYSSLKKYIRNGVLCINGKLFTRQEHKTFSI